MRKLLTSLAAAPILLAGSLLWKAEAAPGTDVESPAPLTKTYTPIEKVGYRRRYYRRGYYRPYYGYGYRPYGYYGYGHMVIMAMGGDLASTFMSDLVGAGVIKRQCFGTMRIATSRS